MTQLLMMFIIILCELIIHRLPEIRLNVTHYDTMLQS
jgi:hypothetical protein